MNTDKTKTTIDRFWSKVNKQSESCWLWTASKRSKGYGAFAYVKGNKLIQDRAHRYSWELHNGPIPVGMCVLHTCDTPACVNPAHLFLGTKADNNRDMVEKGRHVAGGTYGGGQYKRGTEHHNVRLTPDIVRQIRADQKAGASYSTLSELYGICLAHVHRVVHRKVWRHVV